MGLLRVGAMCKFADEYICFARYFNLLFSIDRFGNTKKLCTLPEKQTQRLVECMLVWNENIIMIPAFAEKIYMYNTKTANLCAIELPTGYTNMQFKFFNGIISGNTLLSIGAFFPGILVVDLQTKISTVIPVYKDKQEHRKKLNDCFTRKSFVYKERKLYIASAISNEVLIFDTDTYKFTWDKVGEEGNRYSGIDWDGETFWLAPRCGSSLVRWKENGIVQKYDLSDIYKSDTNFAGIMCHKNKVLLYSLHSNKSICFDCTTFDGELFDSGGECFFASLGEEKIVQFDDDIVKVSSDRGDFSIRMNINGIKKELLNERDSFHIFYETGWNDLNHWLNILCSKNNIREK